MRWEQLREHRKRRTKTKRLLAISGAVLFVLTLPTAIAQSEPTSTPPGSTTSTTAPDESSASVSPAPTTTAPLPSPTTESSAQIEPPAPLTTPAESPSAQVEAPQPAPPESTTSAPPVAKTTPDKWEPTESPKSTVIPGQMRSDREEIPGGFTKEEADLAETNEAKRLMSRAAPGCQDYWPSPHQVCGAIRDKYNSLGGPSSFLLWPTSSEIRNPDNVGVRQTFNNGPIYWHPNAGAHPVVNSFFHRWGVHGYEGGWMGYPITDEIVHADAVGRRQEFSNGAIYVAFQNAIGSAIRNGPLRDKWNAVGAETPGSLLGYPIQDQIGLPGGQGQMDRFERGVIYWHPAYGAHPITGSILNSWEFTGYETGSLGYPASDQYDENGFPEQVFENHVVTVDGSVADGASQQRRNDGLIEFYSGDEYTLADSRGTLEARRAADGYDTRVLSWSWELTESYILNKSAYGLTARKDCVSYIYNPDSGRFLMQDRSAAHKGMLITRRYHLSQGNHDDNTNYQLYVSCGFQNKTVKKNGKGVIAYGYSIAEGFMTYIFRIR